MEKKNGSKQEKQRMIHRVPFDVAEHMMAGGEVVLVYWQRIVGVGAPLPRTLDVPRGSDDGEILMVLRAAENTEATEAATEAATEVV